MTNASTEPGPAMGSNVVLTGFMGTGKSTVGRILADLLGYEFVDTDTVIEERHGPIPEIFANHGEEVFRGYEQEVAEELAQRTGLVIGTGGGLMLQRGSARALDSTGEVFCLTASVDTIVERILGQRDQDGTDRPLLAGDNPRQTIADLLASRQEKYADYTQVETEGRTPEQVAAELQQLTARS